MIPAAAKAAAPPAAQSMSNIESDDVLYMKQNQAERTEVQRGNLAPVYRQVKEGGEHYSSLPALEAGVLIQPKAQFPGQHVPLPRVKHGACIAMAR